jgi:hypothetical protein
MMAWHGMAWHGKFKLLFEVHSLLRTAPTPFLTCNNSLAIFRYVRQEAEGTVQRLRQAQRRDTGLPFVDIIADTVGEPGVPNRAGKLSQGNAIATAAIAEADGIHMRPREDVALEAN